MTAIDKTSTKSGAARSRKRRASNDKTPAGSDQDDRPVVARRSDREPKLPHESDQSSGSQVVATEQNAETMRQAADDVERGLVDTGRSSAVEPLKREHFRDPPAGTDAD